MGRPNRADVPGATWFFTVALQDRTADWLTKHVALLRDSVRRAQARYPFRIDAMVVLPDHLHALWTLPANDARHRLRWMLVRRAFTRRLLMAGLLQAQDSAGRGDAERALWQRRYREHQIRDQEDYARHVDYIHFNPVRHGWVRRAIDWPHSSIHRYVREGRVPADWGLAVDLDGAFGE
jgi:putative transposase